MDMGKLNVNLSPEGERVLRLMMTPYVGSVCAVCGVEYDTVDNLIARNPISTPTFPIARPGSWIASAGSPRSMRGSACSTTPAGSRPRGVMPNRPNRSMRPYQAGPTPNGGAR